MYKIIDCKFLYCPKNGLLENQSLIIKNNNIFDFGPLEKFKKLKYKRIDLKNSLIMPGFVNAHIHLELNWVNKKLKKFNNFPGWLEQIIYLKKMMLKKNLILKSVKDSIKYSIQSGVTTVGQISSYKGIDIPIIKKSNIRCGYFFEIANSNINNFQYDLKKINSILKENELINLMIFPHSIYSLNTSSWEKIKKNAKKFNIHIGTHLSESYDEIKFIQNKKNRFDSKIFKLISTQPNVKRKNNITPLGYLKNLKVLANKPTLVHMNNINNNDKKIIMNKNLPITICPRSNIFLKEKMPDLKFYLEYENTALGTDGLSSNKDLDFLNEIKFLYKECKKLKISNLEEKILNIATLGGAKNLKLDDKIGTLEKNKFADIIGFKIENKNPLKTIFKHGRKNLKFLMINGKIKRLR